MGNHQPSIFHTMYQGNSHHLKWSSLSVLNMLRLGTSGGIVPCVLCHFAKVAKDFRCCNYGLCFLQCDCMAVGKFSPEANLRY